MIATMRAAAAALSALVLTSLIACGPSGEVSAQPAAPRAGVYELEPNHASIIMRVNHLGFSHIVARFDRFRSTLTLDQATPERSSVSAVIDAGSISSGIASFDGFLRGSTFLNAENHPEIRFVSRAIERTGLDSARVSGDLEIRGQTHPVTLDVRFNGAGSSPFENAYISGFSATGVLSRAQWGLGMFAPAVGDEVHFSVEAEFRFTEGL